MWAQVRACLLGASEESTRSLAATVLDPSQCAVVGIAGRPRRLWALRAPPELYGHGVCASDVRVIWVDEKPWGLGLAHSRRRRGKGKPVVCTSVVGSMGTGVVVVFDEELARSQGEDDNENQPDVERHGKEHVK